MSKINLGPFRINPRGEFNPEKEYKLLDLVLYNGSSYLCINDDIIDGVSNIGILPVGEEKSSKYYVLVASKGDQGPIADRYSEFNSLNRDNNIWDYSKTDKIFIDDNIASLKITNTYDGCCGIIISNKDLPLPENSFTSLDYYYTEPKWGQYYIYSFICKDINGVKTLFWNRAVYGK